MDATRETTALRAVLDAAVAGWRLGPGGGAGLAGTGASRPAPRIEAGGLAVNGRRQGPAYKVRAGDVLTAVPLAALEAVFSPADIAIVPAGPDYAALVKPGGLHSASLGPTGGASLEAMLPALFPDRPAWLLSRLDGLTSGLVPVAFSAAAAAAYRRLEDAGQVGKTYLAVVHGRVEAPFVVARELDVADRATTRVLARERGRSLAPYRRGGRCAVWTALPSSPAASPRGRAIRSGRTWPRPAPHRGRPALRPGRGGTAVPPLRRHCESGRGRDLCPPVEARGCGGRRRKNVRMAKWAGLSRRLGREHREGPR